MIVGVFLRHYRVFRNINYVPLSNVNTFTAIIGDNGVGKSTVLEALDHVMNESDQVRWYRNNIAKSEGSSDDLYIVPVFLMDKSTIPNRSIIYQGSKIKYRTIAEQLSSQFWSTRYKPSDAHGAFYRHRDILCEKGFRENKILLIGGRRENNQGAFHFGPFYTSSKPGPLPVLKEIFKDPNLRIDQAEEILNPMFEAIRERYKYIYLPVELDIHEYSKLESESMQHLMDRKISEDIQKLFDEDIVSNINKRLKEYIDSIEASMEGYAYKKMGSKERLSKADLAEKAIENYFSIKSLNKIDTNEQTLPINQLSSGEKKKALIDLVYSFLKDGNEKNKEVIIAIDEPESSINVSSSFDQFEKVKEISNKNQVIITTHWYGFLPVIMDGMVNFLSINKENMVVSFPMNLGTIPSEIRKLKRELKGALPSSIQIKSTTDLVQSIIASLQADRPYNWIICEGQSEKIYFEYFFEEEIQTKNLRILPVAGNKNVKKFYDYILTPISDEETDYRGKVICLIDTDEQRLDVTLNKTKPIKKRIEFLRLLRKDGLINLVDADSNVSHPPTEIEDALHQVPFRTVLNNLADKKLKPHLDKFIERKDGDISALAYDLTEDQKAEIKSFFNRKNGDNKLLFAQAYIAKDRFYKKDRTPQWVNELKNKFL